uniref:Uncharacterized protein n=1 Tax=Anguilla anguilla TaxID=7936 RepID=A0A0E9RPM3_ANGAN
MECTNNYVQLATVQLALGLEYVTARLGC